MRRSTIWFSSIGAANTLLAYAMLEDIGFYAWQETGALIGFPGVILSLIFSGNVHAYPKLLFLPVNFLFDLGMLMLVRKVIEKVRNRA